MTLTAKSVLAEILDESSLPDKGWLFDSYVRSYLDKIVELGLDDSMPAYERQHRIQTARAHVHSEIARAEFEGTIARDQRKWFPCGSSTGGFLGWGESLTAVIADDAATLEQLGHTHREIGGTLRAILGYPGGAENFSVATRRWRGFQDCPFAHCPAPMWIIPHAHEDFTLVNTRTDEGIMGPGLIWHLIAEHAFFEGKFSPYRVDPAQLVKVLFG